MTPSAANIADFIQQQRLQQQRQQQSLLSTSYDSFMDIQRASAFPTGGFSGDFNRAQASSAASAASALFSTSAPSLFPPQQSLALFSHREVEPDDLSPHAAFSQSEAPSRRSSKSIGSATHSQIARSSTHSGFLSSGSSKKGNSSRHNRRRSLPRQLSDSATTVSGAPLALPPHPLSSIEEHVQWAGGPFSVSTDSSACASPAEYYSIPPPKRRSAPTSPLVQNPQPPTTPSSLSGALLALHLSAVVGADSNAAFVAQPGISSNIFHPSIISSPGSSFRRLANNRAGSAQPGSPSSTYEPLEPGKRKQRSRSHSSVPEMQAQPRQEASFLPRSSFTHDAIAPTPAARAQCVLNRATLSLWETFQTVQASLVQQRQQHSVNAEPQFPQAVFGSAQDSAHQIQTEEDQPDAEHVAPVVRPGEGGHHHHHHNTAPYYPVKLGESLHGGRYRVLSLLGRGSFGIVVRAQVVSTEPLPSPSSDSETSATDPSTFPPEVAIKILRKGASFLAQGKREWQVLQYIRKQSLVASSDESQNFVVNALDSFFIEDHYCIVFELLSDTLFELLQRSWAISATTAASAPLPRPGLSLRMVCKMAHQLLCALVTLRGLRIIHADLKPENVALTSPNRPRIKLLDFGSCCFASEEAANQFPYIQSRYYRAPEVLLGMGYGCEIDMWSLGCVIVELYLGKPLFIGDNTIQQLYKIMDVIGQPPESVLRRSAHFNKFFRRGSSFAALERTQLYKSHPIDLRTMILSKAEPNQPHHVEYFIDFVEKILKWDPSLRLTPLDALNHNFILHGPRGPAPAAPPPRAQ